MGLLCSVTSLLSRTMRTSSLVLSWWCSLGSFHRCVCVCVTVCVTVFVGGTGDLCEWVWEGWVGCDYVCGREGQPVWVGVSGCVCCLCMSWLVVGCVCWGMYSLCMCVVWVHVQHNVMYIYVVFVCTMLCMCGSLWDTHKRYVRMEKLTDFFFLFRPTNVAYQLKYLLSYFVHKTMFPLPYITGLEPFCLKLAWRQFWLAS